MVKAYTVRTWAYTSQAQVWRTGSSEEDSSSRTCQKERRRWSNPSFSRLASPAAQRRG
jgi:hypothetical protein